MFAGFKEFIMRGNVMELAVAVVIGAAFTAVVQAVVDGFINPLIGVLFNAESLNDAWKVALPGGGALMFGAVLGAIINFVAVAAVVYFVFVLPMNRLRRTTDEAPAAPSQEELLTEIRDLLRERQ